MAASTPPPRGLPKRIPPSLAYALFVVVWGALPSALSFLTPRYGWSDRGPGFLNLLGLIPLLVGLAGSLWTLGLHIAGSREGLEWEPVKSYLLTRGPYAYSRHPMYLSELTLLFGWVVLYGSVAVLAAFLVWWASFVFFLVPMEERTIEAHFGGAYYQYERKLRRWLGRLSAHPPGAA